MSEAHEFPLWAAIAVAFFVLLGASLIPGQRWGPVKTGPLFSCARQGALFWR